MEHQVKSPIVLLTDFGNSDYYVAMMKGVIGSIAPDCGIIDLSHKIEPYNVGQAAFLLSVSHKYFPVGTIFVVVVDPQVGTSRKPIAVEADGQYYIGPDNGFASYVVEDSAAARAFTLSNKGLHLTTVSNTFHGRDVFAPVAAHLFNGISPDTVGEAIEPASLVRLAGNRRITERAEAMVGEVVIIDNYGNLITNIHSGALADGERDGSSITIETASRTIKGLKNTFGDVPKGELLAYTGSLGYLEIAVNGGNAAGLIDAFPGMKVFVK